MTYAEHYQERDDAWMWTINPDGTKTKYAFLGQCGCAHWVNDHCADCGSCRECDCAAFIGE